MPPTASPRSQADAWLLTRPSTFPALLGGVLFCALLLRLWAARVACTVDFDSGTVGLMAQLILDGERPLFFLGQNYMGAAEAYLAACFVALFGYSDFVISLSPLSFSLGWIAASALLFRALHGPAAGLIAALLLSLSGGVISWFSVASYGGYPAAFCLGTLGWWLGWCLGHQPKMRWSTALALGVVAALAVWTHYLSVPFLLMGGWEVVRNLWHKRQQPGLLRQLAPLALGGSISLIGLLPALLLHDVYGGSHSVGYTASPKHLALSSWRLLTLNLPALLFWERAYDPWRLAAAGSVFCLLAGATLCWRTKPRPPVSKPVLGFLVLFLLLFLPHGLSALRAPRYLIPAFVLGTTAWWIAVLATRHRLAPWLLSGFLALQALGGVQYMLHRATKKQRVAQGRANTLRALQTTDLDFVEMIGGVSFGHEAQLMSALNWPRKPHFVSNLNERWQPWAQAAENSERLGLALQRRNRPAANATMADLAVHCSVVETGWIDVVERVQLPERRGVVIPARKMRIWINGVEAPQLIDRIHATSAQGRFADSDMIEIDLGTIRTIDALWLCSPEPTEASLPRAYRLVLSNDGEHWQELPPVHQRLGSGWVQGDRVYLGGYNGRFERRFDDQQRARFLRLWLDAGQQDHWTINELVVLEVDGQRTLPNIDAIASWLTTHNVTFLYADRWLSGRLFDRINTWERYNPNLKRTLDRSVRPLPSHALALDHAIATEALTLIETTWGPNAIHTSHSFGDYQLLIFNPLPDPIHLHLDHLLLQ